MNGPAPIKILLVEDDKDVRETVKSLLDLDCHTVTEAANGMEAMLLFTRSKYDLVITDYLMPEMRGDELARNIRNHSPTQPILMITSYVDKFVASGLPLDDLLVKPMSIDHLRQAIIRRTDPSTWTQQFYANRAPAAGAAAN